MRTRTHRAMASTTGISWQQSRGRVRQADTRAPPRPGSRRSRSGVAVKTTLTMSSTAMLCAQAWSAAARRCARRSRRWCRPRRVVAPRMARSRAGVSSAIVVSSIADGESSVVLAVSAGSTSDGYAPSASAGWRCTSVSRVHASAARIDGFALVFAGDRLVDLFAGASQRRRPRRRSGHDAAPAFRPLSATGPYRRRCSSSTGRPTAANMRRTWRLRPSWMVISTSRRLGALLLESDPAGAVRPSSSSTP